MSREAAHTVYKWCHTFGSLESGRIWSVECRGAISLFARQGLYPLVVGRVTPVVPGRAVGGKTPLYVGYGSKGGFRSIMHPYRMDPCPQGSRSRGISYFQGVPVHKVPVRGGSVGPWEYGDGTRGSTLHWVYTGVGTRPAAYAMQSQLAPAGKSCKLTCIHKYSCC